MLKMAFRMLLLDLGWQAVPVTLETNLRERAFKYL